ncbi:transposase, partial [Francisella tularensis]|uniref:transposase n=1 Tax=Francisella tularensis TaxID=263 RepID=UPI001681644D
DKDDNQAIGRSVGVITNKIHAMTDALGNPIEIFMSEGKTHDNKVANLLKNEYNTQVIVDKAYQSNEIRKNIQRISYHTVIPCKSHTQNNIPFYSQLKKESTMSEHFCYNIMYYIRVISGVVITI